MKKITSDNGYAELIGRKFRSMLNDAVDYFVITGYDKDRKVFWITMHSSITDRETKSSVPERDFMSNYDKGILMEIVKITQGGNKE